MIRLVAIDLDGTLLSPDKTISPANKQALLDAEAAGVHVVICTGRPLSGVRPIFEDIGFKSNHSYSVINNGCTTVKSSDWSVISYNALSEEDLGYLDQLTQEIHPQLSLFDLNRYIILNRPVFSSLPTAYFFLSIHSPGKQDLLQIFLPLPALFVFHTL